jgi:NhaP-type Na+/H+ or K+/H+ antiporter
MVRVHGATLVMIILSAGLASQWLAWRLGLPAIVVLIASGIVLGPLTGVIEITLPRPELAELIGLGVAIILFEGGMALKLAEWRSVGHGIGRLTLPAPLIAWVLGSGAAHYIAGLEWAVSWVLGGILVVTGPTVIMPLIRQARLNHESASLLKWEGIVNDPIGVLIAVLAFQYFTIEGGSVAGTIASLGAALAAAAVLGGGGGLLTGELFRRGWVPEHLKPPILTVVVLAVYWVSNLVQHEAGLLSVTAMGVLFGNMRLVERESLRHFKENLTVVLLSVLFIVIPATLDVAHFALLDWRAAAFIAAILVLVRPLAIALSTIGAPMRGRDRILLGWIAPRGIVAAATASVFGPRLADQGFAGAEILLPIVFVIILVTVLAHGLTIGPLTRRLDLATHTANGLLIVGANPWTRRLARTLERLDVEVLVADGDHENLQPLRDYGVEVFYGEILSEDAEHELDTRHLSHLLAATSNPFYDALVCTAWGSSFGLHRAFQLAPHADATQVTKRLALQRRGHIAFHPVASFETLHDRLDSGWAIQVARLAEPDDLEALERRLGKEGRDWLLLAGLSPGGEFRLHASDHAVLPRVGWTIVYFAPEAQERGAREASVSA